MVKSIIINVDGSLHKEFKKTVVDNEESMTSIITDCIKNYLASKKKELIH